MKKKISIAAVVIALIVGVYFVLAPRHTGEDAAPPPPTIDETLKQTEPGSGPAKPYEEDQEMVKPTGVEVDERVQRMREEYAVLEEKRGELRSRLDDLRARLYNVKLPAGQAEEANEEMTQAFMLLKSPPMLGAFHNVDDIREEIDRINIARRKLDEIGELIDKANQGEE